MSSNHFDISKISSFATVLLSLLLVFAFSISYNESSLVVESYNPMQTFLDTFASKNVNLVLFLNAFFVLLGSLILSRIGVMRQVFFGRTYLGGIFYILLAMGFVSGAGMLRVYASSFMIILAINHIFKSRFSKNVSGYRFFASGFWIGIASFIYSPSIFAIFALILGVMLFRMSSPREYLCGLGGVLMVSIIVTGIQIIIGYNITTIWSNYIGFFSLPSVPDFLISEWIFIGLSAAFTLLGLVFFFLTTIRLGVDSLKGSLYFVVLLLLFSGVVIFTPLGSSTGLPLYGIVLSMVITNYFAISVRSHFLKHLLFFSYLTIILLLSSGIVLL